MHENKNWSCYSYATGLFKTFQVGNHQLRGQLLGIDSFLIEEEELIDILQLELNATDIEVRYLDKSRQSRTLKPIYPNQENAKLLEINQKGVFIITGGAGGLGLTFAQYLSSKAPMSKILLVGRSVLSKEKETIIG